MEYLGIVSIASWLIEFFSSSENLLTPAEYLDKRSAANVVLVANHSGRKTHQSQKSRPDKQQQSDRPQPSPKSSTSVNLALRWIEAFLQSRNESKSGNREFCQSPEQITNQTQLSSWLPVLVGQTSSSNSASSKSSLKWLDKFLPFSSIGRSRVSSAFPVVQVVRVHPPNSDSKSSSQSTKSIYQVWVQGCLIGHMPHSLSAYAIALQLQHLLQSPNFDPREIQATMVDGQPGVKVGSQFLFVVDRPLAKQLNHHPTLLAIEWIDRLRQAFDTPGLTLAEAQAQMYGVQDSGERITGLASWYGPYFHGRLTANGEIYNQYDFTAAHRSLPFNTYLKVTNLKNGKSAIVRINDRGPYIPPRNLDLSLGAARQLGSEHSGVIEYKATIMKPGTEAKGSP